MPPRLKTERSLLSLDPDGLVSRILQHVDDDAGMAQRALASSDPAHAGGRHPPQLPLELIVGKLGIGVDRVDAVQKAVAVDVGPELVRFQLELLSRDRDQPAAPDSGFFVEEPQPDPEGGFGKENISRRGRRRAGGPALGQPDGQHQHSEARYRERHASDCHGGSSEKGGDLAGLNNNSRVGLSSGPEIEPMLGRLPCPGHPARRDQ